VALQLVLTRTRLGLVIRAGVEDPEMIESLGYRIRRLFVLVFAVGSMLAAIGGAMWGMYVELLNFHVGSDIGLLVFITLIISGLGSMGGCLIGAVLLGIVANYVGFLAPRIGVASDVLLMIAVLLWRPRGLFPLEAK
jgi:branched-chain amino acid transport system permease protein